MKANEYIIKFLTVLDNMDKENIRVPGLILSHAGFGKTSTVKKFCEIKNYNLITLIPSMYSSDDILGLQSVIDKKMVRLTPSWYNQLEEESLNKRTLLFIDEITTCDPYIQGPLLDLIFNRNLGEKHLPNNVFIVAAGNYSSDLNNVFKMSSPLVNRFILLNLENDDFNIDDLFEYDFDNLEDFKKMIDYNNWQYEGKYNYEAIADWIKTSGEVCFGKPVCEENEEIGLLGFTSVRSISNSLKFIKNYVETYDDNNWIRIVADTLGTSNVKEGISMRGVFKSNIYLFLSVENNIANTFSPTDSINIIRKKLSTANDDNSIMQVLYNLKELIDEINIYELTGSEVSKLEDVISYAKLKSNTEESSNLISKINNNFKKKLLG